MALELDERQRAMLEEMHLRVWWPQPATVRAAPLARAAADMRALAQPEVQAVPAPARPAAPAALPSATAVGIDAMDWTALARAVNDCRACQLHVGRKAVVFIAELTPRQADWLVVGEPPDDQEERSASPFAGACGELLDNMLRAVHLSRHGSGSAGARLTNVVKCRPAAVRNPQPGELDACVAYLLREIALVRPKVILAMGRFAAQLLVGSADPELAKLPLGKLRGRVFSYAGVPVVVTHHPARLLRAQEDKADAWADLCLAQRVVSEAP